MGSLEKNFPNISAKPNKAFIIVGFTYIKTGLLKYIVKPPKKVIRTPPNRGTKGIFFSKNQTTTSATMVATINGGSAILRFLSYL